MKLLLVLCIGAVSAQASAQVNSCIEHGVKVFRSEPCDGTPAPRAAPVPAPAVRAAPQAVREGELSVAELQTARAAALNRGDWTTALSLKMTIRERLAAQGTPLPAQAKAVWNCNTAGSVTTCY